MALEQKLRAKARFSATISLLDPNRPELMAAISPVLSLNPEELSDFINRSFRDLVQLRSKLPREKRSRLQLRAHGAIPFGSAIMLDHRQPNGRIQVETKPYKSGLQKSLAFELMRREAGGLYDVLAASYENLIEDSRVINDDDI